MAFVRVSRVTDTSLSSSPINPASSSLQNFWHGSVETSTDTLVPVIESYSNGEPIVISASSIDDITVLPNNKSIDLLNGSVAASTPKNGDLKARILPEVHYSTKLKMIMQANGQTMDDSIVIQPEHQRMNISNGAHLRNDIQTNSNANFSSAFTPTTTNQPAASLYRRRRNSSNSRQSPLDLMSPNGLPAHRATNGRYAERHIFTNLAFFCN